MASRPENSRVPTAVGSIPLVGDLMRQADSQARWLQELVEQNARLVGQLPATLRSFNDALERFNDTVGRLDRTVSRIEDATAQLVAPLGHVTSRLDRLAAELDVPSIREVPELLDTLRREAVPALRAAADTQNQVAVLTNAVERVLALLDDLPGASLVRRFTGTGTASPGGPRRAGQADQD